MDKFSERILYAINALSDDEVILEDANNFSNIDLTKFAIKESTVVETGGFVPFGKKLECNKCFLSISSLKSMWENIK